MDIKKVGNAISYLRKRAGYTQTELASRLGVTNRAISKWERGLGLPDTSLLGKLSVILDTDTDSLLAGDVICHGNGWYGLLVLDKNPIGINTGTMLYDKPLINYLLSYFLLVGIKDIVVVADDTDKKNIFSKFGSGEDIGINLIYNSAQLKDAKNYLYSQANCTNVMTVFGRTFIYGVDQTRFFQRAMMDKDRITILSLPKKADNRALKLSFSDTKKIVRQDDEDQIATQYDYYEIPVLFCPKSKIYGLGFEDFSVKTAFPDTQTIYTEVLDRGYVEMRIETYEDVAKASEFVRIVQSVCGMHIYCPEEIAWRRGMISTEKFRHLAGLRADDYGKYLFALSAMN